MTVKVGDKVKYMPSQDHWLDTDSRGQLLFEVFQGKTDTRYYGPSGGHGRGQRWLPAIALRPGKSLRLWNAKITAVYPDGTASLEVKHPNGCSILYINRIRQDDNQSFDSWHVPKKKDPSEENDD
jgi:hypothetical protein